MKILAVMSCVMLRQCELARATLHLDVAHNMFSLEPHKLHTEEHIFTILHIWTEVFDFEDGLHK